jgi:hypothetical protein
MADLHGAWGDRRATHCARSQQTPADSKTPPAPTTPTDEPPPEPVDDPPAESEPRPPYTVEHKRLRWMRTGSMLQPVAKLGRQVG